MILGFLVNPRYKNKFIRPKKEKTRPNRQFRPKLPDEVSYNIGLLLRPAAKY